MNDPYLWKFGQSMVRYHQNERHRQTLESKRAPVYRPARQTDRHLRVRTLRILFQYEPTHIIE